MKKLLLTFLRKLGLCFHTFGDEPYYVSPDYSDIVYHKCLECGWVGYK